MENFSRKKLKADRSQFHLDSSMTRIFKYSQLGVSNIAIWEVKMQYETEHKQGGNWWLEKH